MEYKIFNKPIQSISPIEQILINRGLVQEDIPIWINARQLQINSPWTFGRDKVEHAIKLISLAVFDAKDIYVVVDCD